MTRVFRWATCFLSILLLAGKASAQKSQLSEFLSEHSGTPTVTDLKDGLRIEQDGYVQTAKKYSPPLRIDMTVRTDSGNIRLHYGDKGMVIFDWERGPTELRMHDPATGVITGFAGKGTIPPNRWTSITLYIDQGRMRVLVQGQDRGMIRGQYKGLSEAIGIGNGAGSKVDIASIKIVSQGVETSAKAGVAAVAGAAPAAGAEAAPHGEGDTAVVGYGDPNLPGSGIDAAHLKLSAAERKQLVDSLVAQVQSTTNPRDNASMERAGKMMGLALLLDPQNRTVVVVHARLLRGQSPTGGAATQPAAAPDSLANSFTQLARSSQTSESKSDKLLAADLFALALDASPIQEEALYQTELLRRAGIVAKWDWVSGGGAIAGNADVENAKYLVDLPEQFEGQGGDWSFGKGVMNGSDKHDPISVNGVVSKHGLGAHPNTQWSHVTYTLPTGYVRFVGGAGVNDSSRDGGGSASPITFSILGDGRLLWTSKPLQQPGSHQQFDVRVGGVKKLELIARVNGLNIRAHAVWLEPRLLPAPGAVPAHSAVAVTGTGSVAGDAPSTPETPTARAVYPAPDLTAPIFDTTKLHATPEQRKAIAEILAGYSQTQLKLDQPNDLAVASKMLGIALRLDSENRAAIVLNARLRRGEAVPAATPANAKPFGAQLAPLASAWQAGNSPDDRALAAYLYSLATTVDPHDDEALFQSEKLRQAGVKVNWNWAGGSESTATDDTTAAAAPAEGVKAVARRQSSIKGLAVIAAADSQLIGIETDVIITAMPGAGSPEGAKFTRDVGDQMKTALTEAIRTVRVRYPNWADADIQISFEDKYAKQDGGSAGAAFSVLLLSVFEGFDIDPQAAITGDITVDGKLRRIGGVDAKLRAAAAGNASCVAIPQENTDSVEDYLVLNGIKALWETQIFAAPTLNDAVKVVRADREPALSEAMANFVVVQQTCRKAGATALTKPDMKEKLDHIIQIAPNHLSAKYLRLAADRKQPTKLSLSMSFYRAFMAVSPLSQALWDGQEPSHEAFGEKTSAEVRLRLRELRATCHPDLARLVGTLQEFTDVCARAPIGGSRIGFTERRNAVATELERLQTRRETLEELLRKGA